MSFETSSPYYCPHCLDVNSNRRFQPILILTERNYSGCGVDIAICTKCDKRFQISYKVDKIIEVKFGDK